MDALYTHAWMQKHPTPTNSGGDFHWHPGGIPSAIRATLTELSSRSRGYDVSAWIVDESYVAWARTFSAVSPSDRRKYTGIAVTIGRIDDGPALASSETSWSNALPGLFMCMPLHPAGPFSGRETTTECSLDAGVSDSRPHDVKPSDVRRLFDETGTDLAAAVYRGGMTFCRDAHADELPALVGALVSWIPSRERERPRTGVFTGHRAAIEVAQRGRSTENFLHYMTSAWTCPESIRCIRPDYARQVWRLVWDLATGSSSTLEEVFVELTRVASSWDSADNLWRYLIESGILSESDMDECDRRAPSALHAPSVQDAGWLWNRLLHYWGRGFLGRISVARLAELLARRITADHLFYLDAPNRMFLPERYSRRLRYEALLSRECTAMIDAALMRHIPSFSRFNEVQRG